MNMHLKSAVSTCSDTMAKKISPSFVHTFELQIAEAGSSFRSLDVSSDHYRRLYNAVLGHLLFLAKKMKSSSGWTSARKMPKATDEDRLARSMAFESLKKQYKITKNDSEKYIKSLVKTSDFRLWCNSAVNQKCAERAFKAVNLFIFGKAKRLRFKNKSKAFNFEGKSNDTGVRILEKDKRFICIVGKIPIIVTLYLPAVNMREFLSKLSKEKALFRARSI